MATSISSTDFRDDDWPLCRGGAEEALLAAQCSTILHDLELPLLRLLELNASLGSQLSLLDTVHELSLKFYDYDRNRTWEVADMPMILRAFTMLMRHSQRLMAFPELKTAFWLRVLQSKMVHRDTRYVHESSFRHPLFPVFTIDFGGRHYRRLNDIVPGGGSHGAFAFSGEVADALFVFMTSQPLLPRVAVPTNAYEQQVRTASTAPRLSVAFKFDECDLGAASLGAIERFLDRTFASADRQFNICMLSFCRHTMNPDDLTALARIVYKSTRVFGVEELMLNSIMTDYSGGKRPGWKRPEATPREYLDIVRAVYDIDTLPALASRKALLSAATHASPNKLTPSRLREVCMRDNDGHLELFATRFSALRYGCALTVDASMYVTHHRHVHELPLDYWRWLAFGLFYPRPKRFAKRHKLCDIGGMHHSPLSAETIVKTMRNPAAELVYDGKNESGGDDVAATTELIVCTVKAGARIEVFKTGSVANPGWTDEVAEQCELEAICEKSDGSVCVVVPGVGLGWVSAEFIERIEREPLSSNRCEQDGQYDCRVGWGYYKMGDKTDYTEKQFRSITNTLIETIGRQFCSINFSAFEIGFLQHCVGLKMLNLAQSSITPRDAYVILDALSGELGDRLLYLNLNYSKKLGNPFIARLLSILSNVDNLPALRQVRLAITKFTDEHIDTLYDVLALNRRLEVFEIYNHSYNSAKSDSHTSLVAAYQGQLLQSALSPETKVAFLSVVTNSSSKHRARSSLDSWLLTMIFAFAADCEVRRAIVWDEDIRCASD